MSTLTGTYTRLRPVQHRVTVLDSDNDIHYFSRTTDCYPEPDGTFRRDRKDYTPDSITLRGAVFIEELDEDGDQSGRFDVLTLEEFLERYAEHDKPHFEYGIQFIPRPRDVLSHGGDLDRAREALKALPVLAGSGEYGIVRRVTAEPGPWERFE